MNNRKFAAAVVVSLLVVLSTSANAAEIRSTSLDKGSLITVVGQLEYGDEKKFIDVALLNPDALVAFKSDGGNLFAGIEIGKAIRLKGYSTFVMDDTRCASACALAWLGGRVRGMTPRSLIGFHAASVSTSGEVTAAGNAIVGAYLNQLGLPLSAIVYITEASPGDMRWLSVEDARKHGIEVKYVDVPGKIPNERTPLVAQSTSPPSTVSREDAARSFLAAYFETQTRVTDAVLTSLSQSYALEVNYYGKPTPLKSVLKDKEAFFRRWPIRSYQLDPKAIAVSCADTSCSVTGTVSWKAVSPERDASSNGVSSVSYTVTFQDGRAVITSESSKVLSRSAGKVSTALMQPSATPTKQNVYISELAKASPKLISTWSKIVPLEFASADWIYRLNGTTAPISVSYLDGEPAYLGTVCMPHNCGGNAVAFLISADGTDAKGLLISRDHRASYVPLGRPDNETLKRLERRIAQDFPAD